MLINKILGNIYQPNEWKTYNIDYVDFEWYELNKRILRKNSTEGVELGIQLSSEQIGLHEGDILSVINQTIVVIRVLPCKCMEIAPKNHVELARFCYEIGNRHAPLFFAEDNHNALLLAYDRPLEAMLNKIGAKITFRDGRLVHQLGSTTHQHEH